MLLGLRTWWLAAVVTPFLRLHVTPDSLAIGFQRHWRSPLRRSLLGAAHRPHRPAATAGRASERRNVAVRSADCALRGAIAPYCDVWLSCCCVGRVGAAVGADSARAARRRVLRRRGAGARWSCLMLHGSAPLRRPPGRPWPRARQPRAAGPAQRRAESRPQHAHHRAGRRRLFLIVAVSAFRLDPRSRTPHAR